MKKLSILMASLEIRREQRQEVLRRISFQIAGLGIGEGEIEILTFIDHKEHSVGHKRTRLVQEASGMFVCFVDDDDQVAMDYVPSIYNTIISNSHIDCIGFKGIITFAGQNPKEFIHSIQYKEWFEKDDVYYRPPNHLNPMRREIAASSPFPDKNCGEDFDWAMKIRPHLKEEVFLDKIMYYYLYDQNKTEAQRS